MTTPTWREIARSLRAALLLTGPWHSGCGCEFGSRGERSENPTCKIDKALKQYDDARKAEQ